MNLHIKAREIQLKDLNAIAKYWSNASEESLLAMGADIKKMPSSAQFKAMIKQQIQTPIKDKKSYALIWEYKGKPIGHTNVNSLTYRKQATMHLHIWDSKLRQKGIGAELLKLSIPFYFENLKLKTLWCEPYAYNPAPNKTLPKVGFKFIKKYKTKPGYINFVQEVCQYKMTRGMWLGRGF